MTPMVSVIMPVYNTAPFLKEAIESVLTQSFSDYEFLIIDDASTDGSLDIIKNFKDERIKIILNENNLGIIATRNKGLELAKGKYIAKMDSDDVSLPSRFEKQVDFLEKHPEVAIVASKLSLINENGIDKGYWHEDIHATSAEEIKRTMPVINCVGQSTVMMRADIVKKTGYNKNYKYNEDWGLWLDVLNAGYQIAKLDEVLVRYRVHSNSSSSSANMAGVPKNLGRFKKAYLKQQFQKGKFSKITFVVFITAVKEYIVFYTKQSILFLMPGALDFFTALYRHPGKALKDLMSDFFRGCKRILTISPAKTIKQFRELKELFTKQKAVDVFFFFPYCHIGGAEKVHANIVEVFKDKKVVVLITGISFKDDFLYMFKQHAPTVNAGFCINHPFTKRRTKKIIFKWVEMQNKPVIFGCNNLFFSESVLKFSPGVRVFDLMHDFKFEGENNLTHTFLEQYLRCEKRIFISRAAIEQVKLFYKSKLVAANEYDKLKLIQNYTFIPDVIPAKSYDGTINVLYVGRGTPEKRAHLVGYIAKKCKEKNLKVNFTAIGELENAMMDECKKYISCTGPLYKFEELETYYNSHHLILITSQKEGFPLTIMEGMAHGLIPFSTPVGDVNYHVNNSVGFITSDLNEEIVINEITAKIEELVNDRKSMEQMAGLAYRYAKDNFSKQQFTEAYKKTLALS